MAGNRDRGGAGTRARIADVATRLFAERGFDEVTVAEVAAAAGVSKVTVFAHFERKEDLLLDRLPDVAALVRAALAERGAATSPATALRDLGLELADARHPLSGLSDGAAVFITMVWASPALVGRLRGFAYEVEADLADTLATDPHFTGDAVLAAALLVAAYRCVAVDTARRRRAGEPIDDVATAHRAYLERAFGAVAAAVG